MRATSSSPSGAVSAQHAAAGDRSRRRSRPVTSHVDACVCGCAWAGAGSACAPGSSPRATQRRAAAPWAFPSLIANWPDAGSGLAAAATLSGVEPTAIPNVSEQHECRQCCAFCDRVVHPAGCIECGCEFLYLYDDEETGAPLHGLHEQGLPRRDRRRRLRGRPAHPPRLRRRQDDRPAAPALPILGRACLRRPRRRLRLRQPGFFEKPDAADFDLRDSL